MPQSYTTIIRSYDDHTPRSYKEKNFTTVSASVSASIVVFHIANLSSVSLRMVISTYLTKPDDCDFILRISLDSLTQFLYGSAPKLHGFRPKSGFT
jgi:hypothetical protein